MRIIRRPIASIALALLLLAAPAFAGATRFDIQTSAAQTATGNGGGIPVAGIKELLVFVTCTANTGTPTLDVYLQSSSDGGTTWYDLDAEWVQQTTNPASATEIASVLNQRTIVNAFSASCATNPLWVAKYAVFGDYIRAAWVMSGTTSYTFSVKGIGKN